jgi:hypothetical protein
MKFGLLFLCAVVALGMASMDSSETANLDETLIDTGAKIAVKAEEHEVLSSKVSAKVSGKSGDDIAAKMSARTTMMIGTHEVDAAAVTMAKAKLKKIIEKVGAKHPEILGEAAQINSLVSQGTKAGYVAGGYARLKKILAKIDEFEKELLSEHETKDKERVEIIERCNKEAEVLNSGMDDFIKESAARVQTATTTTGNINTKMEEIKESKDRENGDAMEVTMSKTITDADNDYAAYWAETEERHQVRNVLMQALWLVCTGFRKFRHTAYCTTLRKQPDYEEGSDSKWTNEGGNDYQANKANSKKFAETMSPVWEMQKVADSEAANQLDGDADMEKGFINNRAPWGVDPAGAGGEKQMTDEQMSQRLSFLIETSYTPERISSPIQGFINALQISDEATQGSLIGALVNIDREEGEAQSTLDSEWYADMVAGMKVTNEVADSQDIEFKTQSDLHQDITGMHKDMVDSQKEFESLEAIQGNTVKEGHVNKAKCEYDTVEVEAILEVNEEELVNVMRLNSLMRFLVIGEKASCSQCNDEDKGSCTWVTRGAEPKGADADSDQQNCKNLEGETVTCNYENSGHNDYYSDRAGVFCACEFGYYGEGEATAPGSNVPLSQKCDKMACPGFGRIQYPATGSALTVTKYPAIGVCSSRHGVSHGLCDDSQGICSQCFRENTATNYDPTPDNIETAEMTAAYPYHGTKRKCEQWMCPTSEKTLGSDVFLYKPATNDKVCAEHGRCHHNRYGYATGRCVCEEPWYGHACHLHKCEAREGVFFPATSPNSCNGKGACLFDVGKPDLGLNMGQCQCSDRYHGSYCELKRCPGFDKKKSEKGEPDGSCTGGTCDSETGSCVCNGGGTACGRSQEEQCPTGCVFKACSETCGGGRGTGRCDRITGQCTCNRDQLLNGPTCKKPKRCDQKQADWSLSMDKWGWSTCKHGYLLVGLKTDLVGTADALYNLDRAICAKPCEGDASEVIGIDKYACYHENWWKKFDTAGGKYCRRNYFVAGLFRSHCNSLYCLEMAKCCQVKKSLWTACKWVSKTGWTGRKNGIKANNKDGFVVGFWRDSKHTLNGLTELRICTPIWWGLFTQEAVR